jgi:hypothetical protein
MWGPQRLLLLLLLLVEVLLLLVELLLMLHVLHDGQVLRRQLPVALVMVEY